MKSYLNQEIENDKIRKTLKNKIFSNNLNTLQKYNFIHK